MSHAKVIAFVFVDGSGVTLPRYSDDEGSYGLLKGTVKIRLQEPINITKLKVSYQGLSSINGIISTTLITQELDLLNPDEVHTFKAGEHLIGFSLKVPASAPETVVARWDNPAEAGYSVMYAAEMVLCQRDGSGSVFSYYDKSPFYVFRGAPSPSYYIKQEQSSRNLQLRLGTAGGRVGYSLEMPDPAVPFGSTITIRLALWREMANVTSATVRAKFGEAIVISSDSNNYSERKNRNVCYPAGKRERTVLLNNDAGNVSEGGVPVGAESLEFEFKVPDSIDDCNQTSQLDSGKVTHNLSIRLVVTQEIKTARKNSTTQTAPIYFYHPIQVYPLPGSYINNQGRSVLVPLILKE